MSDSESAAERSVDRVLAVRYEGWPALGGEVGLGLGRASTVLVGRNAAGKSLLLECLETGARLAAGGLSFHDPGGPAKLELELELGDVRTSYSFVRSVRSTDEAGDRPLFEWRERCTDTGSGRIIWRSEPGAVFFGDGERMPALGPNGLLHLQDSESLPFGEVVQRIRRLIRGIRMVRAGIPRSEPIRVPLRLLKTRWGGWTAEFPHGRVSDAMVRLVTWHLRADKLLAEFNQVCRRLQVLRDVTVHIEEIKHRPVDADATHVGEIRVDGINFGYLSDGTLRVIELILNLIDTRTTVLLLEEPETGIHPGLLQRVLAELEAYSSERQIVVSTHSLALVDWARPDDVRLVERSDGKTEVRGLSEDERQRLKFYLDEDLGLADFLFSGAVE